MKNVRVTAVIITRLHFPTPPTIVTTTTQMPIFLCSYHHHFICGMRRDSGAHKLWNWEMRMMMRHLPRWWWHRQLISSLFFGWNRSQGSQYLWWHFYLLVVAHTHTRSITHLHIIESIAAAAAKYKCTRNSQAHTHTHSLSNLLIGALIVVKDKAVDGCWRRDVIVPVVVDVYGGHPRRPAGWLLCVK